MQTEDFEEKKLEKKKDRATIRIVNDQRKINSISRHELKFWFAQRLLFLLQPSESTNTTEKSALATLHSKRTR